MCPDLPSDDGTVSRVVIDRLYIIFSPYEKYKFDTNGMVCNRTEIVQNTNRNLKISIYI